MLNKLSSKTINFRLAQIDDAEFIYSLRIDEKLNSYISKVDSNIREQRTWLESYKSREKLEREFYFIISRNDTNQSIGTIRLYGLTDNGQFCWGSWVLNENKTRTSAVESAFLLYYFAFECRGYKGSYFQVDKENTKVNSFHIKTGAICISSDNVNNNYIFSLESYGVFKKKFKNFVM